jgi:hypothetical protein
LRVEKLAPMVALQTAAQRAGERQAVRRHLGSGDIHEGKKTMDLEDYLEPEIAITAAVTAAVLSPQVRGVLRRGAVFGLAGALMAGDALSAFARGVGRGVQQAAASTQTKIAAPQGQHNGRAGGAHNAADAGTVGK